MKTSRLTVAAAVAACALIAGCGQNDQVTTTSTTTVASATPAAPTTTAPMTETVTPSQTVTTTTEAAAPRTTTATTTATTTRTQTVSPSTTAAHDAAEAALPQTDPGEYADAAVAAWGKGDLATVKKYVSPSATAKLSAAKPAGDLLRTACEDDMCSYTTEDGKRVTLTFDLDKVKTGQTGGITGVKVD